MAKITGYRVLSDADCELINRIKQHEAETMALQRTVIARINEVQGEALFNPAEKSRIDNAEPFRWASIARTELQQGFMALVRAVAQPETP